ncbi:MAG: hypothetical protein K2G87_00615 [Oscillospiraceae bacterium]|nr:hypothetical protein [Oscillospiraceae bacterium]
MKKIFSALPAIFIMAALAGCSKTAEEQLIDDVTEETSAIAEVVETSSESIAETTSESGTETVADITLFDEDSLFGDWYEVNVNDWEERYSFGKDGSIERVEIYDKNYVYSDEKGIYTVSNGIVIAEYEEDGKSYTSYYVGVMYNDMLIIQEVYDKDIIDNNYTPYDGSMTLAEYLAGFGKSDSALPAVMTHSQEPPSDEIYDFAAQLREDAKAWWAVYNP